jgi:GDP-mannose 6-dehydrogenase
MKISIFGLGYVGCVSLGCLSKNGHNVIGIDISKEKVNQINTGQATIVESEIDEIIAQSFIEKRIKATNDAKVGVLESEISIIAVGTPSSDKGHLDLTYIFKVAEVIGEALRNKDSFHTIAIRSTIMPGTCDKVSNIISKFSGKKKNIDFAVVDNPEFLREGTAVHDYFNPPLTLIGGECTKATEIIASLYKDLPCEIIITGTKVAEIMKYVNNTFHALKISFANEIGNICSAMEIDSHEVMDIFCRDNQLNISPYYFKPGFAYGGSCLPKDLKGLQTLAHDLYIETPVINGIHKTNEIQISRAIKQISKYFGKKIGILGLTFKAGTDDLRNSPSVQLVETLLGKGFDIKIFDANINIAKLTGKNKDYIEKHIPHLEDLLITDLNLHIGSSEVILIMNKEESFKKVLLKTENKIIIDFVKVKCNPNNNYIGINW